ncbi:glycosyltransferase [Lachnospiraceae bacterium 62-35]
MKDLVSVVMPVCGSDYVKESLDSICNQTYENLEIIIIDSSDETEKIREIVSGMGEKRINYFYQEKSGVANALNFGIGKSMGKYIARMDGDDIAAPHRIAVQAEFMDSHPEIDVIASSYVMIDGEGNYIKKEIKQFSDDEIRWELLFDNPICHPTIMFRKAIFDRGWAYQNVFAEDYDLWTRMAISHKIFVLPEVLLKYRVHRDNLSSANVLKVSDSDTNSAFNYINALFNIKIKADKKQLMVKNYHLAHISADEVGEYSSFLISQQELLWSLLESSKFLDHQSRSMINKIILRRWEKLVNASNIIYISEDLYQFPLDVDSNYAFRANLVNAIRRNENQLKRMEMEEIRFFLYGFGERGHRTLMCYQKLAKDRLKNWKLIGVVDREKKTYSVGGDIYQTCGKEDILKYEFDYILISAFDFYKEVRQELLSLHVPDKKIIRDNIIFFF